MLPVQHHVAQNLLEWLLHPPSSYIMGPPDFDGAVLGGRVQKPISSPPETGDRLRVPGEDALTAACSCVPDPHTAILGAAGHVAALRVPAKGKGNAIISDLAMPFCPQRLPSPTQRPGTISSQLPDPKI